MTHVGIDVSKKVLDVAALDDNGEVVRAQFKNTKAGREQCLEWLQKFDAYKVALEATGTYHQHLVVLLQTSNVYVSVLNPSQVSFFIKSQHRRNKTDTADALGLALFSKERQPPASGVQASANQSLAREIEAVTEDLVRLKNRLEAAGEGVTHKEVTTSLKKRIKALEQEKKHLEQQLQKEVEATNPEDRRAAHLYSWCGRKNGLPAPDRVGRHRALQFSEAFGRLRRTHTRAPRVGQQRLQAQSHHADGLSALAEDSLHASFERTALQPEFASLF